MSWLLRLYPRRWRERYGEEFGEVLASRPLGPGIAGDVVAGALDAHRREGGLRPRRLLPGMLLLFCGVLIGWLDYNATDDVQPVAGALLLAGFGFAFWRPRRAWLFVVLLWLAVPLSGVVADANNHHPGLLKPHPLYETLVALIPTALGALAGAGARWVGRRAEA